MTISTMIKKPSAFLPVTMSLVALAIVLAHVAIFGTAREADEGAAAHLWQLLMAAQLPLLVFFAVRWLPRSPKQALLVMALQASAAVAALAPVYFLKL
jgi:FtsH-binding integral membrane protein